jgi:virulence factor Mce-like protein
VAVGVVGAVVALAISYIAFTKHVPLVHGYRIRAVFTSSNELRKNSPVRIAGVDVGRVVGFSDGPGHTREVEMEIGEDGRPIHDDARAKIRPRLFLEGSFYVDLTPGSPTAPELRAGGVIPLSQTATPVQLNQLLDMLNRPARSSFQHVLAELNVGLGHGGARALARLAPQLAPTFRDAAIAAQALQGHAPHDVSTVVDSTSRLAAAVARRRGDFAGVLARERRVAATLAAQDGRLGAAVRELAVVLRTAPPALRALDASLPAVDRFTAAVRPALRVAPPTLRDTAAALAQLEALVRPRELPRLVARLRPTVLDFPSFERRLRELLSLVRPVTDCVRDRAVPVLQARLDDGSLSTGRPVWQDFVHGLVGIASAGQSFDRNGYYLRLSVGSGNNAIAVGPPSGLRVRPRWLGPGVLPPYEPHAPCRAQAPPDLRGSG